jgi:hypothetical protein
LFLKAAHGIDQRAYRHQYAGGIVNDLIGCQEQLKQFDQAEEWRQKWLAVLKAKDGTQTVAYAEALTGLGANLIQQQKYAPAETVLRESLAVLQKQQPAFQTTFHTQALLGAALLGQEQYAAAEPLLVQGYQGMKQLETEREKQHPGLPTPERLTEALERLVQLYDAWGRKDKADEWRQKRQEAKSPSPQQSGP